MKRMVVAVLVVGAVAAGAYLGDQGRVGVARATLQNRVSVAAGEARDTLEHSAALTLHLTCGAEDEVEVRSVDLELPASQVNKARLMSHVPVDCKLTNVQVNAVHLQTSQPREVTLESPQFRNGTARVTLAQTNSGVEITATGTATAGWFGRKIEATARVLVDDAEQRQEVQKQVVAALSGTGAQVAVATPSKPAEKSESEPAISESKPDDQKGSASSATESRTHTTSSSTSTSSSRTQPVTTPSRPAEPAVVPEPPAPTPEPEPEPEPEQAAEPPEEPEPEWQGTTEDLLREVCSGDNSRSWPAATGIELLCSNLENGGGNP